MGERVQSREQNGKAQRFQAERKNDSIRKMGRFLHDWDGCFLLCFLCARSKRFTDYLSKNHRVGTRLSSVTGM